MSKAVYSFRKSEVRRAVDAVQSQGLPVQKVRIDRDRGIEIIIGAPSNPLLTPPVPAEPNDFDDGDHQAQARQ
jgi:hypothetical protein